MHHALRFYSANQEFVVRFYMFGAKFTKFPLVGRYFTALLNRYALTQHAAFILTYDEVRKVIASATSIAVGDCKCRKVFHNCSSPIRVDIVFGVGFDVFSEVRKNAICNCCPCCCVPLRLRKDYGIKGALVRDASLLDNALR